MLMTKISYACQFFIKTIYLCLFFITPLIFTSFNSELFEFNKMIFVYLSSILIGFFWGLRMVSEKKIIFKKTFWDMPLIIFYFSIALSTLFSHDIYLSLFGYYSRFNQGLFSLTAYILLYFAFTSNVNKNFQHKMLLSIIASSIFVATYGIIQHFGLDYFRWVQDVKFRVFSSLGQPNWLGAYLTVTLLITFGVWINYLSKKNLSKNLIKILNIKFSILKFSFYLPFFIISLQYTTLLFTRSRSAFAAFHLCFLIFTIIYFKNFKKLLITSYFIFFVLINLFNILPSPIEKINKLTIANLISKLKPVSNSNIQKQQNLAQTSQGEGGTESFAIRKIVWKGAWSAFLQNPIFGYGNETFALAYYKYKPIEQNMISEWDFLYNKAHNEYLNYLATTGLVGTGSYLLIIVFFIFYFISILRNSHKLSQLINIALFLSWISILMTNFVGFSVVIISLYFYLIPAIFFVLNQNAEQEEIKSTKKSLIQNKQHKNIIVKQWTIMILLLITACYLLFSIFRLWLADTHFAKANSFEQKNENQKAYIEYQKAISLASFNPNYHNEFSLLLSEMATNVNSEKDNLIAKAVAAKAIEESDLATTISPENPIFWNYKALVFHNLSQIDKNYQKEMLFSISKAKSLAPNDPKITYYASIYNMTSGKTKNAMKLLEEAIKLKPNYIEPATNLAKIYFDSGAKQQAIKTLKNLLKYYPNGENIKTQIKEYSNKTN